MVAVASKNIPITELLLESNCVIPPQARFMAKQTNDRQLVNLIDGFVLRQLASEGADLSLILSDHADDVTGVIDSTLASDGKTALMLAVEHGHEDTVKQLIQAGANLDIQGWKVRETALMTAITEHALNKGAKYERIAKLLIDAGADQEIDCGTITVSRRAPYESEVEEVPATAQALARYFHTEEYFWTPPPPPAPVKICGVCTFENPMYRHNCEMCGTGI